MSPLWFKRELPPGSSGPEVDTLRRMLGLPPGPLDEDALQRVRGVQRVSGLPETGVVDAATADMIGESAAGDLAPSWFQRDLQLWSSGEDVRAARRLLGLGGLDDRFDPDAEAAVRRIQSGHRIKPSGVLGLEEAKILGDI